MGEKSNMPVKVECFAVNRDCALIFNIKMFARCDRNREN